MPNCLINNNKKKVYNCFECPFGLGIQKELNLPVEENNLVNRVCFYIIWFLYKKLQFMVNFIGVVRKWGNLFSSGGIFLL